MIWVNHYLIQNQGHNSTKHISYISANKKVMKKIVLLGLIGMSLISCNKENSITLKYAYITRDNIEYSKENHKTVTTHLCPYETTLTSKEIIAEQNRLELIHRMNGDIIIADTLVEINDNVTNILFSKVGM